MITAKQYQDYLNDVPVPSEDRKSEGGRIPDNAKYGNWMRKHDPIAFNVGLGEMQREMFSLSCRSARTLI